LRTPYLVCGVRLQEDGTVQVVRPNLR